MSRPNSSNGNMWSRGMRSVRDRVHELPAGKAVWRIGIAVIGLVIIVIGVVLLPLPGPGWLIIFLGLGIWGTEFAWASRLLRRARVFVSRWTSWVSGQPRWRQYLLGTAGFVIVAVFVLLGWLWVWRR